MLSTNITSVADDGLTGKRARTRHRLVECALELFDANGYEQTTVAQIAAAAGVSEMTFFRYFSSKEQVVLDDPYDPAIAGAIGAQPRALPPLARAVRGVRQALTELSALEGETVRRRVRVVAGSDALRASAMRNNAATEAAIVAQLVADGTDRLPARVTAAAVIAASMSALYEWATGDDLSVEVAVATALDTLEAGHG